MSDLHLVTFRVGTELFGVPISTVQEIVRVPHIARIPQSPDFVEGVVNLRGRIIPVVDLHRRLGHPTAAGEPGAVRGRILVVEADGRLTGVIVDAVDEVIKLSEERVEPAPQMASGIDNQYLRGVGRLEERLLILIDIEKILSAGRAAALDEAEPAAA